MQSYVQDLNLLIMEKLHTLHHPIQMITLALELLPHMIVLLALGYLESQAEHARMMSSGVELLHPVNVSSFSNHGLMTNVCHNYCLQHF